MASDRIIRRYLVILWQPVEPISPNNDRKNYAYRSKNGIIHGGNINKGTGRNALVKVVSKTA